MGKRIVITIGRQFGSGGRETGMLLSKNLGLSFYDKELLEVAAKQSGMNPELFKNNDERPVNSLLYSLSINPYGVSHVPGAEGLPIPQKLFLAQFDAIRKLAAKENCLFVGRCSDYVLRDDPDCVNVFIHAPLEFRITRIKERMELSSDQARDLILKTDKRRAAYYNSYAERKWGAVDSYHLALDSSRLGVEKAAEMIASFVMNAKQAVR